MKTTGKPNTPSTGGSQSYERLLSAAQAAQSAADRAVAELAAIKRTLAEAPRVTQLRREELAKAQQALERAENELAAAREQLAGKQAEAARLIEAAADAQRLLAQALINQDIMPEAQMAQMVQSRKPASLPPAAAPRVSASPSFDPTLGANRYTPMPSMHPADLHAEVMEYLKDRDALCPSCGHSLRGIDTARCPGCRLQLSVNVLKSVRAHWLTATPAVWAIRILAFLAMTLSAYMAFVRLRHESTGAEISGYTPLGCGRGNDCHFAFQSSWGLFAGVPVGVFSALVFSLILLCTGFINIGLTDQTRRRSWSLMAGLGVLAAAASVWFVFVQLAFIRALCPHCIAVSVLGIVMAGIVLRRAPLGRPEVLPERAAGTIMIPRSSVVKLITSAIVVVAVFAGIQFITWRSEPPSRANDRVLFDGTPKPAENNNGLLMKPLDIDVPDEKENSKQPVVKPPSGIEPGKPKADPVFIFPGSKDDPKKAPDAKQPDKSGDAGSGTPGPGAAEAQVEKTTGKDGANAKPDSDIKLDLSPPKPASPDADANASDDEKDGKTKDKFNFAPTIDPARN